MASNSPHAQLTGTWKFWVAASGTAIPLLDAAPSGSWTALGATEGDQELSWTGSLEALTNNNANGPVKHVRPEEGFGVKVKIVSMTLEDLATAMSKASSAVVSGTSGALTVKKIALRRGFIPARFALLARGGAVIADNQMSPYGAWPAQLWIPMTVVDGEPSAVFAKSGQPGMEVTFVAEYDSSQAAGEEFGYLQAQSA